MKPVLAIPLGDPAGIGPEIVLKALRTPEIRASCHPLVVGGMRLLDAMNERFGTGFRFTEASHGKPRKADVTIVQVHPAGDVDPAAISFGKVDPVMGRVAADSLEAAVRLAMKGEVDAIVTPPIQKEAWRAAGVSHIGHTEMLAELTNVHDPITLFQTGTLRVFFLSRHVSLLEACKLVKKDRIVDYARRCVEALRWLGIRDARLAIAALNPHAGEHGMFGREEIEEIRPAVDQLVGQDLRVSGPHPADSVFHQACEGKFDAVLSLYHDQGHIAAKTLDFERTVSLTIGLPFLRTSVDHGTAFDIAGRGVASAVSMVEAIQAAARYAAVYREHVKEGRAA